MELRLLHYFVTLAEELHFGRAAQRLFISQPPLSVAIRQLEDELQAQLFERSSKGVRLTAAGAHLLERARQLLALSRQAAHETQDVAQGTRGHLRLGFVGSSLYRGLPHLAFKSLRGDHPLSEMLAMWRREPDNPLVRALLQYLQQEALKLDQAAKTSAPSR